MQLVRCYFFIIIVATSITRNVRCESFSKKDGKDSKDKDKIKKGKLIGTMSPALSSTLAPTEIKAKDAKKSSDGNGKGGKKDSEKDSKDNSGGSSNNNADFDDDGVQGGIFEDKSVPPVKKNPVLKLSKRTFVSGEAITGAFTVADSLSAYDSVGIFLKGADPDNVQPVWVQVYSEGGVSSGSFDTSDVDTYDRYWLAEPGDYICILFTSQNPSVSYVPVGTIIVAEDFAVKGLVQFSGVPHTASFEGDITFSYSGRTPFDTDLIALVSVIKDATADLKSFQPYEVEYVSPKVVGTSNVEISVPSWGTFRLVYAAFNSQTNKYVVLGSSSQIKVIRPKVYITLSKKVYGVGDAISGIFYIDAPSSTYIDPQYCPEDTNYYNAHLVIAKAESAPTGAANVWEFTYTTTVAVPIETTFRTTVDGLLPWSAVAGSYYLAIITCKDATIEAAVKFTVQ